MLQVEAGSWKNKKSFDKLRTTEGGWRESARETETDPDWNLDPLDELGFGALLFEELTHDPALDA